jgi:hypothetical protein
MPKYDCTLEGVRIRAEQRRQREKLIQEYLAKNESIHKNPVENPFENRNENPNGIEFTFWQELVSAIIFYVCIYLYWFTN